MAERRQGLSKEQRHSIMVHFKDQVTMTSHLRKHLLDRGYALEEAEKAARRCSRQVWRNAMLSGAGMAIVLSATGYGVAVAGIAGSAAGIGGGLATLLHSEACRPYQAMDGLDRAVREMSTLK
jgi:hypothetical protein